MEEKEKKEFIDGFNKGYLIRKYDSELHENVADSLRNQVDGRPLVQGMVKGAEEAELEIKMGELDDLRDEDKEHDLDK